MRSRLMKWDADINDWVEVPAKAKGCQRILKLKETNGKLYGATKKEKRP